MLNEAHREYCPPLLFKTLPLSFLFIPSDTSDVVCAVWVVGFVVRDVQFTHYPVVKTRSVQNSKSKEDGEEANGMKDLKSLDVVIAGGSQEDGLWRHGGEGGLSGAGTARLRPAVREIQGKFVS